MQLARHKSLRMTDWTYTDTTQLPLTEGVETLAALAAPRSSPLNSGQNGVLVSKAVQAEKTSLKDFLSELAESEETWRELDHVVQSSVTSLIILPFLGGV